MNRTVGVCTTIVCLTWAAEAIDAQTARGVFSQPDAPTRPVAGGYYFRPTIQQVAAAQLPSFTTVQTPATAPPNVQLPGPILDEPPMRYPLPGGQPPVTTPPFADPGRPTFSLPSPGPQQPSAVENLPPAGETFSGPAPPFTNIPPAATGSPALRSPIPNMNMPPWGPQGGAPVWQPAPTVEGPVGAPIYEGGGFDSALGSEYGMVGPPCGVDGCVPCSDGYCQKWFCSVSALYMTRDKPNNVYLTTASATPQIGVMGTKEVDLDWQWGYDGQLGYLLGANCAVAVNYWGLTPSDERVAVRSPANTLSARLDFANLAVGAVNLGTIFNNSREHYLQRHNELHNIELNFLHQPLMSPCSPCGMTFLAGVRYFRFDEGLRFGAAAGGTEFGPNAGDTSAFYDVDVANDLLGGQIGIRCHCYPGDRLRLHAMPRVGVYVNRMNHRTQVELGSGVEAIDIGSGKEDVSIMGQLDMGLTLHVWNCWSIFASYRVVAVSGLALSDNQIPATLLDTGAIGEIDSNAALILHGGVCGLQCMF